MRQIWRRSLATCSAIIVEHNKRKCFVEEFNWAPKIVSEVAITLLVSCFSSNNILVLARV